MARSKVRPTSAHAVRPADIDLVMAFGDSITAGYCAFTQFNVSKCVRDRHGEAEVRGLSFGGGGDLGLDEHITIPSKFCKSFKFLDILKKYNPNVFGAAHGNGTWDNYNVSYLNMAISGERANNLPAQAKNLVATFKAHPEVSFGVGGVESNKTGEGEIRCVSGERDMIEASGERQEARNQEQGTKDGKGECQRVSGKRQTARNKWQGANDKHQGVKAEGQGPSTKD